MAVVDAPTSIQKLQFALAVITVALAAVATTWSVARVVRRKGGPYHFEALTGATGIAVVLWSLKYLLAPAERGGFETLSSIGFLLFLATSAVRIAWRRQEQVRRERGVRGGGG